MTKDLDYSDYFLLARKRQYSAIPKSLLSNEDFLFEALSRKINVGEIFSEQLCNNFNFMYKACALYSDSLFYVGDKLRLDRTFIKKILSEPKNYFPSQAFTTKFFQFSDDFDIVHTMVKRNPANIIIAGKDLKNDLTLAHLIAKNDPKYLTHFSEEIKNNAIIARIALKNYPLILEVLSSEIKNNYDLVKIAVKHNGLALQFAAPHFKKDLKIAKMAVNSEPKALEFVDKKFKNNLEFVCNIVKNNASALKYASGGVQKTFLAYQAELGINKGVYRPIARHILDILQAKKEKEALIDSLTVVNENRKFLKL